MSETGRHPVSEGHNQTWNAFDLWMDKLSSWRIGAPLNKSQNRLTPSLRPLIVLHVFSFPQKNNNKQWKAICEYAQKPRRFSEERRTARYVTSFNEYLGVVVSWDSYFYIFWISERTSLFFPCYLSQIQIWRVWYEPLLFVWQTFHEPSNVQDVQNEIKNVFIWRVPDFGCVHTVHSA